MTLNFKQYRFAPKWYFVILTLCLCALFIRLGYWQLQRAAEKENLQATFSERLHLPPLSLDEILKKEDRIYYPVQIKGHYDNAHTIVLDNKIHAHQVGYEVLTPLIIAKNQPILLINRGWIPATATRNVLPAIPQIIGEQTVLGYVYITPGKSFSLGSAVENTETWPLRMQVLDIPLLKNKWQQSIYPFVLLLAPDAKSDFVRDWQPIATPAQKHRGYAVQWFAFAFVLVIIFIVLNIRKK